jgi:hypothetical protein
MFEGEGSITIGASRTPKGKDVYALQCKVPNTDHSIIDFFHHHWPGSIGSENVSREDRQPQRIWIVKVVKARDFLEKLKPHRRTARVLSKAKVASRLMRLKELCKKDPANEQKYLKEQLGCYHEMKQLNLRGAAANRRKAED